MPLSTDRDNKSTIKSGRSLGNYNVHFARLARLWRPPTDVYETDHHMVIKIEIPGMDEGDFEISMAQGRLVVAGHRQDPPGKIVYHNMEIHHGEFRSEVLIDWVVEEDAIEATYERGFLFIKLPKARQYCIPIVTSEQ